MYNSANEPGKSDFMAFGVNNGFPEFRFDCGSGHAIIVSAVPVRMGEWQDAHLKRTGRDGKNGFYFSTIPMIRLFTVDATRRYPISSSNVWRKQYINEQKC